MLNRRETFKVLSVRCSPGGYVNVKKGHLKIQSSLVKNVLFTTTMDFIDKRNKEVLCLPC